jgi:hypothetical protein
MERLGVVDYLKVLFWHMPGRTEENNEKPQDNWWSNQDSNHTSQI